MGGCVQRSALGPSERAGGSASTSNRCYRAAMIRSFLTVSSGTLASRLLGFVRDSLVAALLGAGAVADAFLAAFQLVNVIRRLLSEGGLNAALVPAWLRVRETEGAAGCGRLRRPRARHRHGGVVRCHVVARAADAVRDHGAGAGVFRPRDAAARRRQCPPDAALPRLCRTGDRDDGAVERARPFCTHGVFAAAVQYRA